MLPAKEGYTSRTLAGAHGNWCRGAWRAGGGSHPPLSPPEPPIVSGSQKIDQDPAGTATCLLQADSYKCSSHFLCFSHSKPLSTPAAPSLPLFTACTDHLLCLQPCACTMLPLLCLAISYPWRLQDDVASSRQSSLISASPLLPQHFYQSEGTASLILSLSLFLCRHCPAPCWAHYKHPRVLSEWPRSSTSN